MEVHAHSHTARKKWTHYFWEFFMLFLAVTAGFFVENLREHKIEKDREVEYIQSYIEDLQTDTAEIRRVITTHKRKLIVLDSFMLLLSNQKIKGYESDLYFHVRRILRSTDFRNNDRTISQLKNSGGMRLIKNKKAADRMFDYQNKIEGIEDSQLGHANERKDMYPTIALMFNPFVFDQMVTMDGINKPENNPPLLSYDPALQYTIAFYVHQLKGSNYILQKSLENLYNYAIKSIELLKNEYHLK